MRTGRLNSDGKRLRWALLALVLLGTACRQGAAQEQASEGRQREQKIKVTTKAGAPVHHSARAKRIAPKSDKKAKPQLIRVGASGSKVGALQFDLEDLGYWTGGADESYGPLLEQAVFAFQGAEGLTRDGVVGPKTRRALASAARPSPRSDRGNLIEIDKDKGLLYVVRNGETKWAIHISSGSNVPYEHPSGKTYKADTADGKYKIYSQFPQGWHKSPLGQLWRPKFFNPDGIALHGFSSVPPYPASHGCVRMSIEAMNFLWRAKLAPMKSRVWVY